MAKQVQSNLTTPQQVAAHLLNSNYAEGVPTEAISQYDDFFAFMTEFIPQFSEEVTQLCGGITFIPYMDEKDWLSQDLYESKQFISIVGGIRLFIQDFLLEVNSVEYFGEDLDPYNFTDQTGTYIPMPRRAYPYTKLDFKGGNLTTQDYNGFAQQILVDGFWGYHTNPGQLYVATGDTAITINASAPSLTVDDIGDYWDLQYLRIEDEIMLITARTSTGNILTVERGVNGTTKAAHTSKPVTIIKPMRDIQSLAVYIAAYNYQNRNTIADAIQVGDIGVIIPKFPQRYQATIDRYQMLAELQLSGAF